ncbi:MAG: molybdenum cofactor biosynthesis protein MoaA [Sulfurovum sp. PC08-66]|nr:MAG: molybdenum cofactor biosynthesis protein MoaA [Sulfurovum sp. PC08-66]
MPFISFDESMRLVESITLQTYKKEKIFLMEALGCVLAQDIVASYNSPEFPTSAMDGYAIVHDENQQRLPIASINPAGNDTLLTLQAGSCIKTFTGSLMPLGSDTLVPIENVRVEGESIIIHQSVPKGFAVREIGENYRKDEVLIPQNTLIDIAHIGVMATLNIVSVWVYQKPIVAILSTGSELLELGAIPTHQSQIRSSNNYILEAMVKKYGGKPLQMGCIADDRTTITHTMLQALNSCDILLTTGGVSVGDFDFVKDSVQEELGCDVLFQGVKIKPGQHLMIAQKGDKFVVALPGFAYSSTVTALLYLLPLMAKFQNTASPLKTIQATLKEPFSKKTDKKEFRACNCYLEKGHYAVDFVGKKVGTSAILTNMLGNIGLLVMDEDETTKAIGESVRVILLD